MNSLSATGRPSCRVLVAVATLLAACGSDDAAGTGGAKGGGGGAGGVATGGAAGGGGNSGRGGSGGGSAGQGGAGGAGGVGGSAGAVGTGGASGSDGTGGAAGNAGKGGAAGGAGAGPGGASGASGSGGASGAAGAAGASGASGNAGTGGSVDGGSVDAGDGGGNVPDASADARNDARPDGSNGSDAISDRQACDAGASSSRQTARAIGTTTAKNGYWEYLPPNCGSADKPPLLVFWHGIGENGTGTVTDLAKVTNGPARLIRDNQWPASRPFVVLSPQHGPSGCPSATEIHDFISYGMSNYDIDATRVYLTGLSCGAMGSADYLAQYAGEQVAAAVLIAGRATPAWNAKGCALVNAIGLWAFHGDADTTVPISDDNTAMPQFIACPQPPRKDVQYTVYPGVGHDSWTRTYNLSAGHDIYSWFLGFKK